jgi:hypothetical protein
VTLSYADVHFGGVIDGRVWEGKRPYPWLMFTIMAVSPTNDRYGNYYKDIIYVRIVVTGTKNTNAYRSKLKSGIEVAGIGHIVKARHVAEESGYTSNIVLADRLQFPFKG